MIDCLGAGNVQVMGARMIAKAPLDMIAARSSETGTCFTVILPRH
jgi:hypothetical protein